MIKLISLLLMFSCSTNKKINLESTNIGRESKINVKNFLDLFPKNSKLLQLVTYERDGIIRKSQVIFNRRDALLVTVLSPIGIELISLKIYENKMERLGGIKKFKIPYFLKVMGDMLVVYASKTLLSENIIGDIDIVEGSKERRLVENGTKIMTINYEDSNRWKSDISLEHHLEKYKLKIERLDL